jgi:hypothetical protein
MTDTLERYDQAFEKGNAAYHAAISRAKNPYIGALPSAEASGWAAGWDWARLHDPEISEEGTEA